MNKETSDKQNNLPDENEEKNTDKSIKRLARSLDRVYGNPWSIIWRNFLGGLAHAIGATIGYVLFLGIAILIAQRLGVFTTARSFWENFLRQLPFRETREAKEAPATPEEFLEQFKENNQPQNNY